MRFYFLDRSDLIFLFLLNGLVIFFIPYLGVPLLALTVVVLWFLRIRKYHNVRSGKLSCLAPISGKVLNIEEKDQILSIDLRSNFFGDWGIYAPFDAKVSSFGVNEFNEMSKIFKKKYSIKFSTVEIEGDAKRLPISFKEKDFSLQESFLNIDVGDRINMGSLLGYRLFGGKMRLDFPRSFGLKVKKGDSLKATKTVIGEYR